MTKTREDVLRLIDEAGVRYIRLCFTDILGHIKGMNITIVTSAKTDEEALELLDLIGVPFRK